MATKADEGTQTDQTEPEKTYTQADLDKAITARLARESKAQAGLRAELEAGRIERESLAARLHEIESKGKSAEDILREQAQAHEKRTAALQAQNAQAQSELAAERQARKAETFNARLLAAVSTAKHPARAALLARAEIPGLGVDDAGNLTLVDPVTELPGNASEAIAKWLKGSPDLLPAAPAGPTTLGGKPAVAAPTNDPLAGLNPGAQQISAAFFGRR